ncbi:MAG: TIGR00730 family Rossman fold protein [Endomicrobia bacterium]|nr:TIGR00730 family Rossman fold protein [Endomicrobiia bacterium]
MNKGVFTRERACVFCGASSGRNKNFQKTSKELGKLLAKEKIDLVYGGGNSGLMGALANSVLTNGGKVIGVIPEFLKKFEACHSGLSELIVTESMHKRKEKMYSLADYFIILPGGIGTIDEFSEIFTWSQLCLHSKACALLNVDGYYDAFLDFLNKAVEENFISMEHFSSLIVCTMPDEVLKKCRDFKSTSAKK